MQTNTTPHQTPLNHVIGVDQISIQWRTAHTNIKTPPAPSAKRRVTLSWLVHLRPLKRTKIEEVCIAASATNKDTAQRRVEQRTHTPTYHGPPIAATQHVNHIQHMHHPPQQHHQTNTNAPTMIMFQKTTTRDEWVALRTRNRHTEDIKPWGFQLRLPTRYRPRTRSWKHITHLIWAQFAPPWA